jgi:hypothetical protein
MLINDGTGAFTRDDQALPPCLEIFWVGTSELIDLDGDSHLDLIVTGNETGGTPSLVFWGDGTGVFTDEPQTTLPAVAAHGIINDIDAADLDRDGLRDLVMNRTTSPPRHYEGYYLQVVMQVAPRQFRDETAERIPDGSSSSGGPWGERGADWIRWIRLLDTNHDGPIDILIDDAAWGLRWLNDGTGVFTRATTG